MADRNPGCDFITFVLGSFEPSTGRFTYVRAGHVPPYLRKASGELTRLDALSGPPLGLDETARYRPGNATLGSGERLLIVTDGFIDAQDSNDAPYGDARVAAFVAGVAPDEASPLQRLYDDVRAFEQGQPAFDNKAAVMLTLGP